MTYYDEKLSIDELDRGIKSVFDSLRAGGAGLTVGEGYCVWGFRLSLVNDFFPTECESNGDLPPPGYTIYFGPFKLYDFREEYDFDYEVAHESRRTLYEKIVARLKSELEYAGKISLDGMKLREL